MATKTGHVVQNVGEISFRFAHASLDLGRGTGSAVYIGGFRLNGEILTIDQLIENSTLVPILGGGSVQLTNSNKSCRMTANTIRTTSLLADGTIPHLNDVGDIADAGDSTYVDFVTIADALREIDGGDGIGGTFELTSTFNGIVYKLLLLKCTLVSSQLFKVSGNDVPTYQTIFNIGKPLILSEEKNADETIDELRTNYGI
jgi:hypothetical protein